MKTIQLSFAREFVDKIISGEKYQTCRREPKRIPEVGDQLRAFTWAGKPYRSKQETIGYYTITDVFAIGILGRAVFFDDSYICEDELIKFVRGDGFDTIDHFLEYCYSISDKDEKDEFEGIVIRWEVLMPK